jgi:uncharacterized delta-60 repeat protein
LLFTPDGVFDSSYGASGYVPLPTDIGLATPRSMTIASDASTVLATTSSTLLRITSTGVWDPAFGVNGTATIPAASGKLFAVDAQADGTFLATGRQQTNAWLLRATATGALDTSFGTSGEVVTTWVGAAMPVRAIAVGANIFVGGTSATPAGPVFVLARYSANGAPDPAFTSATISGTARDMVATQSSTITLVGDNDSQPTLVRYDANGSLDASFGNAGVVTALGPFTHGVTSMVAEQSDGAVLVLGNNAVPVTPTNYVVRLLADGSVDTSFANGGLIVGGPSQEVSLTCLGLQSDGRIVVGGFEFDAVNEIGYAMLQRYWP